MTQKTVKDYYAILGVSSQASLEEIRLAYRRLARVYHPDLSIDPDAEEHFKEVNEAYDILANAEKRRAYDYFTAGTAEDEPVEPASMSQQPPEPPAPPTMAPEPVWRDVQTGELRPETQPPAPESHFGASQNLSPYLGDLAHYHRRLRYCERCRRCGTFSPAQSSPQAGPSL